MPFRAPTSIKVVPHVSHIQTHNAGGWTWGSLIKKERRVVPCHAKQKTKFRLSVKAEPPHVAASYESVPKPILDMLTPGWPLKMGKLIPLFENAQC